METKSAVKALIALAQETRLSVFRVLVQAGTAGLPAGEIAKALGVPNATLSFHLKELVNAGLITARQESRFIFYAADFAAMNRLMAYLTENCCAGEPCGSLRVCCPPAPEPTKTKHSAVRKGKAA
jgi:DNA-binding transcriptional ArsR family regulator